MKWNRIASGTELNNVSSFSHEQPVLLFKHSNRCSISAAALARLERGLDDATEMKPFLVDVIGQRPISGEIAERLHIEHQSPQVLVIRNGECIYSASHFGIQPDDLKEALEKKK
ncbi:MAG: bacillithiol system redox-active protein YtxJ [Bacteroidota bacterium]|nr:bacillithiol system redox-active protein YtxJ [Bacteroidota bacterium]